MDGLKIGKKAMAQFAALGKLISQDQVAEMLDVSPRTLEFWRCHKFGPRYVKIGRLVKYREADILAYIEALTDEVVMEG